MRVAGLDISLSSTGLALVDDTLTEPIWVQRIQSDPVRRPDGERASLQQRHDRLTRIENRIIERMTGHKLGCRGGQYLPDLVVVEGPSMGSVQGAHEMSGNWWRVVRRVLDLGVPVVEVPPLTVKLYATGSGSTRGVTKVTKRMVVEAVRAGYGDAASGITSDDEADALVLAAIGCRFLGRPIESAPLMPAANMAAFKKIRWPERTLI